MTAPLRTVPETAREGSAEAELLQSLRSWAAHCEEGARAVERHDLDRVLEALAGREALRQGIEAAVARLRSEGSASGDGLDAIRRLRVEADLAEQRLVQLLATERTRLRREIDGEWSPAASASANAYTLASAASPHRLNIVR